MLKEWLNDYYASLDISGRSQKTIRTYSYILDAFVESSPEFTERNAERFYHKYCASSSLATRNLVFSALSAFGDWLCKRDYIPKNPMNKLDRPKTPDFNPKPIPKADYDAINKRIGTLNLKYRVAFGLLRDFALRAGELEALNIESFDLNQLDPSMRVMGKGSKTRVLPINAESQIYFLLLEYLEMLPDKEGPLFLTQQGTRESYSNFRYKWKQIAGKYTIHQLRHTKASMLVNAGVPIRDVQILLGHSTPTTTIRYTLDSQETRERLRGYLI